MKVGTSKPRPADGPVPATVEIAPAVRARPQAAQPPKVDTNYLRIAFGAVALVVLLVYLVNWLQR